MPQHLLDAFGVPMRPQERNTFLRWSEVANLLGDEAATMFVTSTEWGWGMEEMRAGKSGNVHFTFAEPLDPAAMPRDRIKLGPLTVCNAGTEDRSVVNMLNWMHVPERFLYRKRELKAGYARPAVADVETM